MDEARRYLRFVAPGLVFLIELALLLWLGHPSAARRWSSELVSAGGEIGLAISLLIVSGGLGAIFTHVHHFLHWTFWCPLSLAASHKLLVAALVSRRAVAIETLAGAPANELTHRQAWIAVTILWFGREGLAPDDPASSRVTALADLVHSSGTVLVASFFAVAAAVSASHQVWEVWAAGVVLLVTHGWSYRNTSKMAMGSTTGMLLSWFAEHRSADPRVIVIDGP